MDRNLPKTASGVETEPPMIFAEDSEREAIEVVAVCGIAKGAEVRVMGRRDVQAAVFLEKAVKLLHGAD